MRFVFIIMATRMADILCAAMLRSPLNAKDISGDFTAFDYQNRRYTRLHSFTRLLFIQLRLL